MEGLSFPPELFCSEPFESHLAPESDLLKATLCCEYKNSLQALIMIIIGSLKE